MRTPLLLACLAPASLLAQFDYFANEPVWRVGSSCNQMGWGGGNCVQYDDHTYTLAGDTVINGNTYKKVLRTGWIHYTWFDPWPAPQSCMGDDHYTDLGLPIRQVGRTIRVWSDEQDQLLFDFDLEVGDTLPATINSWGDIVVTGIDSVEMNGEWRPRFALEGGFAQHLVEGMGSDNGLYEPIGSIFECGHSLTCFGLNGTPYYPDQNCFLWDGLPEQKEDQVHLFMDNSTNTLIVDLGKGAQRTPLLLYDAQGRVCLNMIPSGAQARIDLSRLSNGIYVANIGSLQQRLVIVGQ